MSKGWFMVNLAIRRSGDLAIELPSSWISRSPDRQIARSA